MKKVLTFILTLTLVISGIPQISAKTPAIFLYVATDGNDDDCGNSDHPLKTVSAALALAEKEASTVVINIRGGVYPLTETINLKATHSDIVIRSCNGEDVTFTGSNTIPMSAFEKCTDTAFLDALCEQSARDSIVCTDITKLGITEFGKIAPQGLYLIETGMGYAPTLCFDKKPLTLAQYPNEGYIYTESFIKKNKQGSCRLYDLL